MANKMYQQTWHCAPEDLNICVSLKLGTNLDNFKYPTKITIGAVYDSEG
jgi:hypothetical protein